MLATMQMGCPALFGQDQRSYSVAAQIHDSSGAPVGVPMSINPDVLQNIVAASDPGPVHLSFERARSGEFIKLKEVNVLYRLPSGEQVFVDLLNREKTGEKSLEAAAIAFLILGGAYGVAGEFVVTTGLEVLRLEQLTRFTVRVPFGDAVESAQVSVKFDFVDARDRVRESVNFNRRIVASPSAPPVTEFVVPNVTGQHEHQGINTLQNAGFTVGTITHECSATVGQDRVIRTSPASGSVRNLGTAINLVVSTGSCPPTTGTVPNVVGDTQAVATTAITGAGFVVGTVTTVCSDTVPSGKVISQSPSAGSVRNLGTAINLVVSSGPCPTSNLEVSFKVQNQAGQFVALPGILNVPFGHSRVFELVVSEGMPDYLVTLLDYDGHGIQFRLWFKGKDFVLSDEAHFRLSEDQMYAAVSADALDEIFMSKGVEILNRVGATLSVDLVVPGKVHITKDYTAATQSPQTSYLFVSDSSEPMQEVEKTWQIQVE